MMEEIKQCDLKYAKQYVPNDIYWGIGIENETYFVSEKDITVSGKFIKGNMLRERYSVDYLKNYSRKQFAKNMETFSDNNKYNVPVYINSHTFTKTDINGEHETLYTYTKTNNPKFNGRSIHNMLMSHDVYFQMNYENTFTYDGDAIEFITQNFYKTTVSECVNELVEHKYNFVSRLNEFNFLNGLPQLGFPEVNYGIVQFKTNPKNVNVFNNGTYHLNFTIPTQLDNAAKIKDPETFMNVHKNAMKMLQWIEPFLIAFYGSPDVFSINNSRYSSGSLRMTSSRYIGIGTYDVDNMPVGKILNEDIETCKQIKSEWSWYSLIYQNTDYLPNSRIGFDFNYLKHYNAGIEFRIFDYFPTDALTDIMNLIILLFDHSQSVAITEVAISNSSWNETVYHTLLDGYTANISTNFFRKFFEILMIPYDGLEGLENNVRYLVSWLFNKYGTHGTCSVNMSPNMQIPRLHNVNRYMWDANCLQYFPIDNIHDEKVTKLYESYTKKSGPARQSDLLQMLDIEEGLDITAFYKKILTFDKKAIDISKYVLIQ